MFDRVRVGTEYGRIEGIPEYGDGDGDDMYDPYSVDFDRTAEGQESGLFRARDIVLVKKHPRRVNKPKSKRRRAEEDAPPLPVMDADPSKRPRYIDRLPTRTDFELDRIAARMAGMRRAVGMWLACNRDGGGETESLDLFNDDDLDSNDNTLASHPVEAVDRFEKELKGLGYTVLRTATQMTLPCAQL